MTRFNIQKLPAGAEKAISKLRQNGFEAYAVGGCVRDSIMGKAPDDWDICTSAKPDEVKAALSRFKIRDTGLKHGTVTVVIDDDAYEITTYRHDRNYELHRRPSEVEFIKSLDDDLARRDFTINALCFDGEEIIDRVGGIDDINLKTIRAVGNPDERFKEDALRILRALRFASVLGFSLEKKTEESAFKNRFDLRYISRERVRDELLKLLGGENAAEVLDRYKNIIAVIIPEIRPMFDFEQRTPYHNLDVWGHTIKSVESIKPNPLLRLTMLLHDIGKPHVLKVDKNGRAHFKTHPEVGEKIAAEILSSLKLPNRDRAHILSLILEHDNRVEESDKAMRRLLCKYDLSKDFLDDYMAVRYADSLAQSDYKKEEKFASLDRLSASAREFLISDNAVSLKELKVGGNDLLDLGFEPKRIGKALNTLVLEVCAGRLNNDKKELIDFAERMR